MAELPKLPLAFFAAFRENTAARRGDGKVA